MSDMGDIFGPIAGSMIVSEIAGMLMLVGGIILLTLLFWRGSFVIIRIIVGGGLLLVGIYMILSFDPADWQDCILVGFQTLAGT